MATPAIAKPSFCLEKQRLGDAYEQAAYNVLELQIRFLSLFANGGKAPEEFNAALQDARKKREVTKDRYLFHLRTHGC